MSNENNSPSLRQQLETALDFISRSALGHDTGHCVHFANKAEAELRSIIDVVDALLAENAVMKASLMFWDADSPESPYDSPEEIANDLSLDYNEEFEVQVAARLPNRKYRVCETRECQCQLELIEGAEIDTPATSAALAAIEARGEAQGVEKYAELFKETVNMEFKHNQEFYNGTVWFAKQLREGK